MLIQWYPGHMAKAERKIREETAKADLIIVIGDARAVGVSVNSDFYESIKGKRNITIYNKSSMADKSVNELWQSYFKKNNENVFFTDCSTNEGISEVVEYIRALKSTFRFEREVRAIVAGIPNVGKSMFINTLTHRGGAKTGNMPGVTRGTNWIHSAGDFLLLDTPGVLPPKFRDQNDAIMLAALGCVKDTILDKEELALKIIEFLLENYPKEITERYKIEVVDASPLDAYETIAKKRGFILRGGEVDYARCASTVIDEFKNGVIGRISFCRPE